MPVNFHTRLGQSNRPRYGLWMGLANATTSELCAGCGFDWLLIDAEHGPNTLLSVLDQLRALKTYPGDVITRLPSGDTDLIKRYLDIGAHTLLIPMVDSAEQARTAAQAVRYPPVGQRGLGTSMARAARWNQDKNYLREANQRVSLIVQIESESALENLSRIASVEGVDAVFIGPSDLSASMGWPGQVDKTEVVQAVEGAIQECCRLAVPVGVLALHHASAQRYVRAGASFVGVGVDTILLSTSAQTLAHKFIHREQKEIDGNY